MANLNPHYQLRQAYGWGPGVTTKQHIAEIYGKQPAKLNNVMVRAFTANNGPQFSTFLRKHTQVRTFDTPDEYTWKLVGSFYKNIPLIECRRADGSIVNKDMNNVGQGGELLQLVFPEAYFADGEYLVGEKNEFYQFRVLGEPVMEGTNAVYTVQMDAGSQEGCPGEELIRGKRFSYDFAAVEDELSRKVGGIRKHNATTLRNEWTTIRKYNKFTGAADTQLRLDFSMPVIREKADGTKEKAVIESWFDNEMWIFTQEWEREKERARMYSRSNRNTNGSYMSYGKSGKAIKQGDGIYAQMLYGNTHYYNDFNENFDIEGLCDAIYSIYEQGNIPIEQRKIVVTTGNRGMIQVNKAIHKLSNGFASATTGYSLNGDALGIVNKVQNPAHSNSLGYGAQFTEYRAANGLTLTFFLDPSLDDTERNKIPGPNGKGVLSSYAYYIFDLGSSSEPNMYLCQLNGPQYQDTYKYILGMRNPFGLGGNVITHDEDSSEIHCMTTLGACILDPTRCMMYLPAGLVA